MHTNCDRQAHGRRYPALRRLALASLLLLLISPALPAPQPEPPRFREGIWRSHGYGELIVVTADQYSISDITSATCVERDSGPLTDSSRLYLFPKVEYPASDRMVVSGNFYQYEFQKIRAMPQPCLREARSDDPLYNFDVFWHSFDENYVSFEQKGIDWAEVRRTYRPRIRPEMTEAELYTLLGEIVERINDPHVFLSNRKQGNESLAFSSPDPHGIARALEVAQPGKETAFYRDGAAAIQPAIEALVRYELLGGAFSTAFKEKLTWGLIGDVGYLRASLFSGLFTGSDPASMQEQLDEMLDRIFNDFAGASGLIIDVSTNTGGAAFIPNAIAQRIVRESRVILRKKGKAPGGFTEPVDLMLQPSNRPGFRGPVVILISQNTVSSGEQLLFALSDLPYVTTIGETTLGAHSDIMMKNLPYGGIMGISNEVVVTSDGEWLEGRGFAPEVPFTAFDPQRPISSYRAFVDAALRVLEAQSVK